MPASYKLWQINTDLHDLWSSKLNTSGKSWPLANQEPGKAPEVVNYKNNVEDKEVVVGHIIDLTVVLAPRQLAKSATRQSYPEPSAWVCI